MPATNEEPICRLVWAFLAAVNEEELSRPVWVDRNERRAEAVEATFESATRRYALEHTRVEAFSDQIRGDEQFLELLGPLDGAFSNELPSRYYLSVGLRALEGVRRSDYPHIRECLLAWVQDVAPALQPDSRMQGAPPGVPFEVSLRRGWLGSGPGLLIQRHVDPDLEIESCRLMRIRTALDRKCPKLHDLAVRDTRWTCLILESADLPFSNGVLIAQTAVAALRERADQPDAVYLVETEGDQPWPLWIIKQDQEWWPAVSLMPPAGPIYLPPVPEERT